MTKPDISVLLVTHNHDRFVDAALASIAAQFTDKTVEVVVADDDSSDGTLEKIAAWSATAPFAVRVLPPTKRLGITRNYARGFAACHGTYVAVLEGDDEWISVDKLALQAKVLDDNDDLAMVAGRFIRYDSDSGDTTAHPLIGCDKFLTRVSSARLAESNWFGTFSACMYRREALKRVPAEVFESTAYDWMIALAVTEYGDAALIPQVVSMYRVHSGGMWSGASLARQHRQLQDLIPTYMDLLGGRLDRQLSGVLVSVERQLRALPVVDEDDMPVVLANAVETAPRVPLPRVATASRPQVSVVMTSYNHSAYVLEAVESVLSQTTGDLELVIVDDRSTDDSVRKLETISDARVRTFTLDENIGAAAALNFAIQQTRGEFVAVINSDDVWERHKLARQLRAFDERPEVGAVFSAARFIDEKGRPLAGNRIPAWAEVFRQANRSQGQWLRYFMTNGNALCHPSILVRRDVYEAIGLYDNTLRQIPDLDRWVALVKHCPIEVLGDEPLVRFRTFSTPTNASALNSENVIRNYHEHMVVNSRMLEGVTAEQIFEGFSDVVRTGFIRDDVELRCAAAFLWIDVTGPMRDLNRAQGLAAMHALLADDDAKLLLRTHYGVRDQYAHQLAGHAEIAGTFDALHALHAFRETPERQSIQRKRIPELGAVATTLKALPVRQWPAAIAKRAKYRPGRAQ